MNTAEPAYLSCLLLSEKLKVVRELTGLNKSEMARAMGYAHCSAVTRAEGGLTEYPVTPNYIRRFKKAIRRIQKPSHGLDERFKELDDLQARCRVHKAAVKISAESESSALYTLAALADAIEAENISGISGGSTIEVDYKKFSDEQLEDIFRNMDNLFRAGANRSAAKIARDMCAKLLGSEKHQYMAARAVIALSRYARADFANPEKPLLLVVQKMSENQGWHSLKLEARYGLLVTDEQSGLLGLKAARIRVNTLLGDIEDQINKSRSNTHKSIYRELQVRCYYDRLRLTIELLIALSSLDDERAMDDVKRDIGKYRKEPLDMIHNVSDSLLKFRLHNILARASLFLRDRSEAVDQLKEARLVLGSNFPGEQVSALRTECYIACEAGEEKKANNYLRQGMDYSLAHDLGLRRHKTLLDMQRLPQLIKNVFGYDVRGDGVVFGYR